MSSDEPGSAQPGDDGAEDRVRGLLGQVGAERPELPPEVAARLDETLAGLVRERERAEDPAPATGGGRPRHGRLLLVAAAAVVVLGLGGVTVAALQGQSAQDATSKAAGAAADRSSSGASIPLEGSSGAGTTGSAAGQLPVVRADHLAADVRALLRRDRRAPDTARSGEPAPMVACVPPPRAATGELRAVRYDHTAASLLVLPPRGGHQVAEVWSCTTKTRLARVRLTTH